MLELKPVITFVSSIISPYQIADHLGDLGEGVSGNTVGHEHEGLGRQLGGAVLQELGNLLGTLLCGMQKIVGFCFLNKIWTTSGNYSENARYE